MLQTEVETYKNMLVKLCHASSVSGYEYSVYKEMAEIFQPLTASIAKDVLGNLHMIKLGDGNEYSLLVAAHLDEIGLMVTRLDERGFLHFTNIGGIDPKTLLNQEVIVHGREDVPGIICLNPLAAQEKPLKLQQLGIDIGYPFAKAEKLIKPGDVISIKRDCQSLLNDMVSGKTVDDKAGIVALAVLLSELQSLKHRPKLTALATVQEEVDLRGAATGSYSADPAIAVAIDVTHAQSYDTKNQVAVEAGKGPVIAIGPNINRGIADRLCSYAQKYNIPYQINPIPGPTGTDARAIQLLREGIPTALLAIPIRYMHTSVETVSMLDIINCGRLLAFFVSTLPKQVEDILCY